MEEVYNTNQLNKDIETISEIVDRFYNMIWCQQDNSFNFDKLNKYLIKDVDSIIHRLNQNENKSRKNKTIYITEAQYNIIK